jgi:hypothetical protein
MPVALSAFHWQPVRRTKKIASIAARSGTRGLWQPKGCLGRSGSSGAMRAHTSSGKRQPSSFTGALAIVRPPERQKPDVALGSPVIYRDRL